MTGVIRKDSSRDKNKRRLVPMDTVDWVAGISTFFGIVPLVGLPGVLVLAAVSPVMELIYWGRFRKALQLMTDSAGALRCF